MTISTYNTLITALDGSTGWTHRNDVTTRLPEFIALAEADMQSRCGLLEFETTATVTITSGSGTLPTDLLAMRSAYWDGSPDRAVDYVSPVMFDDLRANDTGDGYYYTLSGSTIRTTPMGSGSLVLTYRARFTPITVANQSNSIITNYPDVYLYGALKQFALWNKDKAAAQDWQALMDDAVTRMQHADERRRYAGATLQVRTR